MSEKSVGNDDKHYRPATLCEALSVLKAVHPLSPAEQREIDEAIRCIGSFDGVTDAMVDTALEAAKGVLVDTRRFWTDGDRAAVRAMLEAVIEANAPRSSVSAKVEQWTKIDFTPVGYFNNVTDSRNVYCWDGQGWWLYQVPALPSHEADKNASPQFKPTSPDQKIVLGAKEAPPTDRGKPSDFLLSETHG